MGVFERKYYDDFWGELPGEILKWVVDRSAGIVIIVQSLTSKLWSDVSMLFAS